MMKLIEETWTVSEPPYLEEFYGVGTKLNSHQTLYVVSGSHAKEADVMAAATLIAAAPEMARLLLLRLSDGASSELGTFIEETRAVLRKAGVIADKETRHE